MTESRSVIRPVVHAERQALIRDLDELTGPGAASLVR